MRVGTIAENERERELLEQGEVHTPFFEAHVATLLARTITVATRLGVFDAIAAGATSAAAVAATIATSPAATAKLLDALRGSGYLRREDGRYELTTASRRWLLRSAPRSIRDYVLALEQCEWRWAEGLERYVRSGRPSGVHDSMSDEQWRLYQRGMRALASFAAPELVERVPVPDGARALLDVGGSHGFFSVALCRRYPSLRAEVFDLPGAVAQAAPLLAAEVEPDRVRHRAGDARSEDFGAERYDVILVSHLAHHFDEEQNRGLVRRCARALRAGGVLVIQEGIRVEEAGEMGQVGALIDLFCGLVSGGGSWSFAEMEAWQSAAGLEPLPPVWLESAPGIGLQMARRGPVRERGAGDSGR